MANERSIAAAVIGAVVGAIGGFGGGWIQQEQNLAALRHDALVQAERSEQLRVDAYRRQVALDLITQWQDPAMFAKRHSLQLRLESLGPPRPIEALQGSLTAADEQDLQAVLGFFERVRTLNDSGELDTEALSKVMQQNMDYWRPYIGGCPTTSNALLRNASIGLEALFLARVGLNGPHSTGAGDLLAQVHAMQANSRCAAEPLAVGPERPLNGVQG